MPRKTDARVRMIESGVELFRERGLHATAFSDVLARSQAPRGSVYHHFPGGREQFSTEVIEYAGGAMADGLELLLSAHSPLDAYELFVGAWAAILEESQFGAGCPVLAAVVEGEGAGPASIAAAQTFARWEELIAGSLVAAGAAPGRARPMATMVIAAVEGGVALARADRSLAPFERVTGLLREQLEREVGGAEGTA